jgi:3-carboxy-cis,cis-muconate cycloisomerase
VPEAFLATGAALAHARATLEGLIVEPERMRRNLELTGGAIVAEAVMMALAAYTGRQEAHHIIAHASRSALANGRPLLAELEREDKVTKHLDAARLRQLTDPANYLGSALAMVDRLLAGRGRASG